MRVKYSLLIVSFFGLLCCALHVALHKPDVSYFSFIEPNQIHIWIRNAKDLQLDLASGAICEATSHTEERQWSFPDAKVSLSPYAIGRSAGAREWIDYSASVTDNNGLEAKYAFKFPQNPSSIEFLNSSTVVCIADRKLYAVDLRAPTEIATYPLSKDELDITTVPNSQKVVVSPYFAPLATDPTILLDLSDLQNIALIATWSGGNGITAGKDCLYERNANKSAIIRRSLVDGSKLGDLVLSPEIQSVFVPKRGDTIELHGNLILIEQAGDFLYFDFESQHALALGRTDLCPLRADLQPYPVLLFFAQENSPREMLAYDPVSHQVLWEFKASSDFTGVALQSPEKIILGTNQFGLSIDVIDTRTGKVLNSLTPFRYFSWLLAFTEFGFAVWIVTWLRSDLSRRIPVWLHVVGLALVATMILCSLQIWTNWWPDQPYLPQRYCQGIFLGLATSGLAWLMFGQARVGIRYLPLVVVVLLLILFVRNVIPENLYHKSAMVCVVLLHIAAASIAFGALRLFGFRFKSQVATATNTAPFTLRDLFVLAAVVAVVVTAARPVVVFGLPDMDYPRAAALVAYAIGATCMVAVFSNSRFLFATTCILVATIYAAMMFESLFQFVTALPLFVGRDHLIWHWFRISTAGLVTTFVVIFAYRCKSNG